MRTRTKFLCYSSKLRTWLGIRFWMLLTCWLRGHGLSQRMFYQTDWGNEFGGVLSWKLEKIQRKVLEPWNVQLLRIRKGQWKDNAYVERTHRTDDEEFYIPQLKTMRNHRDHFKKAWAYVWDFNTARPHYGYNMNENTPMEAVKASGLDLPKSFFAFPPLLIDCLPHNTDERGHDLSASY